MNAGEYGVTFYMGVSFDISGNTSLVLEFTRPDGSTFMVESPSVSVGSVPLNTYLANQYCIYTFVEGNVTVPGIYYVRLTYIDSTRNLLSGTVGFYVEP